MFCGSDFAFFSVFCTGRFGLSVYFYISSCMSGMPSTLKIHDAHMYLYYLSWLDLFYFIFFLLQPRVCLFDALSWEKPSSISAYWIPLLNDFAFHGLISVILCIYFLQPKRVFFFDALSWKKFTLYLSVLNFTTQWFLACGVVFQDWDIVLWRNTVSRSSIEDQYPCLWGGILKRNVHAVCIDFLSCFAWRISLQ